MWLSWIHYFYEFRILYRILITSVKVFIGKSSNIYFKILTEKETALYSDISEANKSSSCNSNYVNVGIFNMYGILCVVNI